MILIRHPNYHHVCHLGFLKENYTKAVLKLKMADEHIGARLN